MAKERRHHVGTRLRVPLAKDVRGGVECSRPHVQLLGVVEVAGQRHTAVLHGFYLTHNAGSVKSDAVHWVIFVLLMSESYIFSRLFLCLVYSVCLWIILWFISLNYIILTALE